MFAKDFIKRLVFPIVGLSVPNQKINFFKTVVFNLRVFGLKGLMKTPIYVYTNTKLYFIGSFKFNVPLERGLIKIGDMDYKSHGCTKFLNMGTIEVNGPVAIGGSCIIENYGLIRFGGYNRIGDGTTLVVRSGFELGFQSGLGFHSLVMDSDDHFTIDTATMEVKRNSKPIKIGAYNFIGNSTFIKKGTITPDYFIVASANALLTKDYTSFDKYSVVGGSPARLLKTGIRRIFNLKNEHIIMDFFVDNSDVDIYKVEEYTDLDTYCSRDDKHF